jgi:hypothetical protein
MPGNGNQESERGSPSMSGSPEAEDAADFEDPFLREVARGEPPLCLPAPDDRMGGPDGLRFEILEEWPGTPRGGQRFAHPPPAYRRNAPVHGAGAVAGRGAG